MTHTMSTEQDEFDSWLAALGRVVAYSEPLRLLNCYSVFTEWEEFCRVRSERRRARRNLKRRLRMRARRARLAVRRVCVLVARRLPSGFARVLFAYLPAIVKEKA
jgi:hypothetical protein